MLQVEHLSKSYRIGNQVYPVLKDISIEVEKGEFVAVMGPSGSGKTTLLNCISRFIPYDEGAVLMGGEDISRLKEDELAKVRNRKMGFVFQDFMLLDGLTVFENICLPQIIDERPAAQMESKAENICRVFGIDKIMQKYPAEISGGEKQRTAVARALMNHPLVILADEPTGNLDSKSCRAVIDAFLKARDTMQATVFMVTHDSFAASFCDRVIILKDGQVSGIRENRGDRKVFMDELLDTIRVLGGDFDDNE
nr:ABC transporter ATP-binding protein [uncultured Blautia sp.]